jgi:hypothetical protein
LGVTLDSQLVIEADEIRGHAFGAQLPQQRHDLPAMIGRVVRELMQRLPERIGARLPRQVRVADGPVEIR